MAYLSKNKRRLNQADNLTEGEPQNSIIKSLVTVIVILIIIIGGIYLVSYYTGIGRFAKSAYDANWQAVFLTNGQVYFGKITKETSDYLILKDIYYLQVISQQDTLGQPADVQEQPEQRLTLIKLGNEIHGPKDEMKINREHVVIIENLTDNSRVVEAINNYIDQPIAPQQ